MSDCLLQRYKLQMSPIRDAYIPQCDEKGSYKRIQCSYAWGLRCWCANERGAAIHDTAVTGKQPNCSDEGV